MHFKPDTIEEALALVRSPASLIVAGGTDLYASHGDRLPGSDLVDLSRIAELKQIGRCPTGWMIGARATWSDILTAHLPSAFDGIRAAARGMGSEQVRRRGTLVGNICTASPAADGVPPLLALRSEVILVGRRGTRRLPLEKFIKGAARTALRPGEIVMGVQVPHAVESYRSAFVKLGTGRYMAVSTAIAAVTLRRSGDGSLSDLRIAVGAVAPVARRLAALEKALEGARPADLAAPGSVSPRHLTILALPSDIETGTARRLTVVAELCRRAVLRAATA